MAPPTDPATLLACPRARSSTERGFGVVEVLVAALLVAVVITAVGLAAVSASKLQTSAELSSAMTDAGRAVEENLTEDRTWMERCGGSCTLERAIDPEWLELKGTGDRARLATSQATAVDSAVDGREGKDEDRNLVDYYRVAYTIQPSDRLARRFQRRSGKDLKRAFVTAIDPRGRSLTGSVVVQGCRAVNQVDERMTIHACNARERSSVRMGGCPSELRANFSAVKCPQAFEWALRAGDSAGDSSVSSHVKLRAVKSLGSFTLVSATDPSTRFRAGSARRENGAYVFDRVPAGTYFIRNLPARRAAGGGEPQAVRWKEKEIPAYHGASGDAVFAATLTVEPGLASRALVLYKPATTGASINLNFSRQTWTHHLSLQREAGIRSVGLSKELVAAKRPMDEYKGRKAVVSCDDWDKKAGEYLKTESNQATDEDGGLLEWSVDTYTKYTTTFHLKSDCVPQPVPGRPNCAMVDEPYYYLTVVDRKVVDNTPDWVPFYDDKSYDWKRIDSSKVAGRIHEVYCSWVKEWVSHDGYLVKKTTTAVKPGARFGGTYVLWAAPQGRAAIRTAVLDFVTSKVGKKCSVSGHVRNGFDGTPTCAISGFDAGLYSGLEHPDDSKERRNFERSGTGSWVWNAFWVRPNGAIDSSAAGGLGSSPSTNFSAYGECYVGGAGLSYLEGYDCYGKCEVAATDRVVYSGYCGAITRSCAYRDVWETAEAGRLAGDRWEMDGPGTRSGGRICQDFSAKPWLCKRAVLRVVDGSCVKQRPVKVVRGAYSGPKGQGSDRTTTAWNKGH